MPDLIVVQELQTYLVAQSVGQLPGVAASLTVPSIWTEPRDGAALPRNIARDVNGRWIGETTVTIKDPMLGSPSNLEAWIEESFIDIIVRSPQSATAQMIHRQIRGLLHPFDSHGGRKQWMMGALLVESSSQWRVEQAMPQRQAVTENDPHQTFDRVASYRFSVRRKILAGLTVP